MPLMEMTWNESKQRTAVLFKIFCFYQGLRALTFVFTGARIFHPGDKFFSQAPACPGFYLRDHTTLDETTNQLS